MLKSTAVAALAILVWITGLGEWFLRRITPTDLEGLGALILLCFGFVVWNQIQLGYATDRLWNKLVDVEEALKPYRVQEDPDEDGDLE